MQPRAQRRLLGALGQNVEVQAGVRNMPVGQSLAEGRKKGKLALIWDGLSLCSYILVRGA